MKSYILPIFFILSCFKVFPQNSYNVIVKKADSLYHSKKFKESLTFYTQAFALKATNKTDLYNAACSAALSGEQKKAFALLDEAMGKGWINILHLKKDPDLLSLHSSEGWTNLTEKMQRLVDKVEAQYDKPLQKELLEILESDQTVRKEYLKAIDKFGNNAPVVDSLGNIVKHTDSLNLIRVTRILDEKGWVHKDKVGERATQALFLVIQHSDLITQEKYYPLMKKALKNGQLKASSLALLEDRMALRNGKRQIYGTQIYYDNKFKKYYVAPLNKPEEVDKRRLQVGLGLITDYVKRWNIVWDIKNYESELSKIELNK